MLQGTKETDEDYAKLLPADKTNLRILINHVGLIYRQNLEEIRMVC